MYGFSQIRRRDSERNVERFNGIWLLSQTFSLEKRVFEGDRTKVDDNGGVSSYKT